MSSEYSAVVKKMKEIDIQLRYVDNSKLEDQERTKQNLMELRKQLKKEMAKHKLVEELKRMEGRRK